MKYIQPILAALLIAIPATFASARERNLGIGVYPGDPSENYARTVRRGLEGNNYYLDGNAWRMRQMAGTYPEGERISLAGFDDSKWMQATVPSTNYMNFVRAGLAEDPNYGDNIFREDHGRYADDFWYRTQFELPAGFAGDKEHVFLNFDGVNWKAHVFMNGKRVGKFAGAFCHGRFDVTDFLKPGVNTLAVKVIYNAHPGVPHKRTTDVTGINGGVLGADNPTFHASVGWDWIPTIPGRNCGIWDNVYLSAEGPVKVSDPLVETRLALPDTTASVTPSVVLTNAENREMTGTLRFAFAGLSLEKKISLAPKASVTESFSPEEFPALKDVRLPLWWPVGMGSPVLHEATFEFIPADGGLKPDVLTFNAGLRQIDFKDTDTNLKLYVNGRRFVPLGGNWGFSEANLRYGKREYDTAVGLHRSQNFNTIRNWVGQIGNEEFYDACDRNGVMVWQDFWLANPYDGPDPYDEDMFMANAAQLTSRIRRHPSLLLYCGRNEGNPPADLNRKLEECVGELHPGMLYIPNSADYGVSGRGPYQAKRAEEYFADQSGKIHSERGMPAPLTREGYNRTLPDSLRRPILDRGMALHDFCRKGAQNGESFVDLLTSSFGEINNADTFCDLSQWISYDGYRAMFESTSKARQGLLLWMSHSAWPSMVWQTYDYYFEPTGAFFGSRKACEPLHIQYNPLDSVAEVVNRSGRTFTGLTAAVKLRDMTGKVLAEKSVKLTSGDDTTESLSMPALPADYKGVYFIDLSLNDGRKALSVNRYVMSAGRAYDYRELRDLPKTALRVSSGKIRTDGGRHRMDVKLRNTSGTPAMLVRLNLLDADGGQILPVDYSDNYFHLLPGETASVTVSWNDADARSDAAPSVAVTGMNL